MRGFLVILAILGVAVLSDRKHLARKQQGSSRLTTWRNGVIWRLLASMPEDTPPRLIMSILPRLQAQNDEILALLAEQNDLLRKQGEG